AAVYELEPRPGLRNAMNRVRDLYFQIAVQTELWRREGLKCGMRLEPAPENVPARCYHNLIAVRLGCELELIFQLRTLVEEPMISGYKDVCCIGVRQLLDDVDQLGNRIGGGIERAVFGCGFVPGRVDRVVIDVQNLVSRIEIAARAWLQRNEFLRLDRCTSNRRKELVPVCSTVRLLTIDEHRVALGRVAQRRMGEQRGHPELRVTWKHA